jgi:hypothetical protein
VKTTSPDRFAVQGVLVMVNGVEVEESVEREEGLQGLVMLGGWVG